MTENQRLKRYIEHQGISQRQLGAKLGVTETSVSKWFKQNLAIPSRHLITIFKTYSDLYPRWLLTGKGDMLESKMVSASSIEGPSSELNLLEKLMEANQEIGRLKTKNEELVKKIKKLES